MTNPSAFFSLDLPGLLLGDFLRMFYPLLLAFAKACEELLSGGMIESDFFDLGDLASFGVGSHIFGLGGKMFKNTSIFQSIVVGIKAGDQR